jgi:signal transduction histidine kinase
VRGAPAPGHIGGNDGLAFSVSFCQLLTCTWAATGQQLPCQSWMRIVNILKILRRGVGERIVVAMTESTGEELAQGARREPLVLANIAPRVGQRRMAQAFMFVLVVVFGATWPFRYIQLPKVDGFLPAVAGALFVADIVASALLFAHFSILRHWALLIIASGYLFSGLMVFAHALSFPGAFTPNGFLVVGPGLQSAVWIYWIWHAGFNLSFIGYALLRGENPKIRVGRRATCHYRKRRKSVVVVAIGSYWFCTVHENLLPIVFTDVRPISLFRKSVIGISLLVMNGISIYLLWMRRRSLLDEWILVANFAFLLDVLTVSTFANRFEFGWYAGRFYLAITAMVLMVALLGEITKLYASLARSNVILQNERDDKLTTREAMAGTISHEVRQPLAAIATRSDTSIRLLGRVPIDVEKVRSNLTTIVSESHRASQVFDNVRALFGGADSKQQAIDLNEIALGALHVLRAELEERGITTRIDLAPELPLIIGHSGQMQAVIHNLVHNAIEAMDSIKDGRRVLQVRTEHHGRDAIALAIEDSGPGIDAQKIGNIFDPFVTTKPRGMGLGLAICRMTVERHGGRLSATSDKNKGALFQFILPINSTESDAIARP